MGRGGTHLPEVASLLASYNPWWREPKGEWRRFLPTFERPILASLQEDLRLLPQMVSLTGPHRVGKSTLLLQLVTHLLDDEGVPPQRILYFSLDDPALFVSPVLQSSIFDLLVEHQGLTRSPEAPAHYFLLDEIQRLPRWELFLKKHYDLHYPIRFVVSVSASPPIFRKSRESLLGRIKDRHLLPFSFREFCLYRLRDDASFGQLLRQLPPLRPALLAGEPGAAMESLQAVDEALAPYHGRINDCVCEYWREGGFPEVWRMPDVVRKQEYLWDSLVRRVIHGDLAEVTGLRKPENVMRFFLYLLTHPGTEVNTARIARDAGVTRQVVEDNFRLLELTDLVRRMHKFTASPLRVRLGNVKCYVVDMALRNAVMKTWHMSTADDALLSLYAENAVANHLMAWTEAIEVAFYRQKDREVDFVVSCGGNRHLPVEVKHRRVGGATEGMELFMKKYGAPLGVVVTRELAPHLDGRVIHVPLRHFLLAT
ncbi:MAG: ATP-binding protein [Planctomycetes bacterium]|nr:ATP-binding protein [Planctomycetota bacterium]